MRDSTKALLDETVRPNLRRVGRRRSPIELIRSVAGQSLAEFSLIFPVLLTMFFGTFEFSRLFYTQLQMRHAVAEATRFAVTGEELYDPNTGQPVGRVNSITQTLISRAAGLPVALQDVAINPSDGGGPEDIVTISVTFNYNYSMAMMDNLGSAQFSVTSSMRNEPFFPDP